MSGTIKGRAKEELVCILILLLFWKAFVPLWERKKKKGTVRLLTLEWIWLTHDSKMQVVAPAAQITSVWLHSFCFKPQSSLCKCKCDNWVQSVRKEAEVSLNFQSHKWAVISHRLYHDSSLMWCSILKESLSMYGGVWNFIKNNYLCIVCNNM